jgi:L-rhamnose isomerase
MSSFKVRDSIIHIPTYSSSNEIKNLIVVFIHLQLTLGRVVNYRQDHVRLLHDLSDSTTLTQKIVASSILPIIKIITIEEHKLDCTFLHVASGLQKLLKPTIDQIISDTN